MTLVEWIIAGAVLLAILLDILLTFRRCVPVDTERLRRDLADEIEDRQAQALAQLKSEINGEVRASRTETTAALQDGLDRFSKASVDSQVRTAERQDVRLKELTELISGNQIQLRTDVADRLKAVDDRFTAFTTQSKESMEGIRTTVQGRLEAMQLDNSAQLEKMRATVDEKLQKTLDERITQSFQLVNERLQEVYKGLGEMKTLANGVGDLKKVLSNVKTRGIVGEYQLAAILEEMLSREQYEENVATKPGSANRVEFAIKLPGEGEHSVYLPVDSKFPADAYTQLVDAYEAGDTAAIGAAQTLLETRLKMFAKDIHDKYIDTPYTTDFAILFLPFEGLYAEVVRRGMVEVLQRQYKVNIAGPTTFAALLNSLQMGFRTLAIQKRSSEVWNVLGAVKTEFATFSDVLEAAQKRIEQTGLELDKLVGVRTRKINSKLRQVSELPVVETKVLLETDPESEDDD